MRCAVGVLVAAVLGLNCSAPLEPSAPSEPVDLAGAAPPVPQRPRPAPDPSPPAEVPAEVSILDLSAHVRSGPAPRVTSVVSDASGATYATGTFTDSVAIGDTLIRSRGDKDVFLVKLSPTGALAWVRAVGSVALESAPHVSLEDEGRVIILGMTKGEMDCGTGPLNTWDSPTFFLCIFGGPDGRTLAAGVFPTGNL